MAEFSYVLLCAACCRMLLWLKDIKTSGPTQVCSWKRRHIELLFQTIVFFDIIPKIDK